MMVELFIFTVRIIVIRIRTLVICKLILIRYLRSEEIIDLDLNFLVNQKKKLYIYTRGYIMQAYMINSTYILNQTIHKN